MALKFWENHAKEMRRARLLQASAVIYSSDKAGIPGRRKEWAVETALELEKELAKQLSAKSASQKS